MSSDDEKKCKIWLPASPPGGPPNLPASEPPITRRVLLPEKVAVRYIAEESGQSLDAIASVMRELRIIIDVSRSLDFKDAAKLLRRYGIEAERQV
jgi:hypothetical protein